MLYDDVILVHGIMTNNGIHVHGIMSSMCIGSCDVCTLELCDDACAQCHFTHVLQYHAIHVHKIDHAHYMMRSMYIVLCYTVWEFTKNLILP